MGHQALRGNLLHASGGEGKDSHWWTGGRPGAADVPGREDWDATLAMARAGEKGSTVHQRLPHRHQPEPERIGGMFHAHRGQGPRLFRDAQLQGDVLDRKSTRLNSSHLGISYAVFCLKKKTVYFELSAVTTLILLPIHFLLLFL